MNVYQSDLWRLGEVGCYGEQYLSMLSLSCSPESLRMLLLPQGGSHLSCFDREGMQVELPGRKWKRLTKATTSTYFIFGVGAANVTRFQGPSGDWEGGKDPGSTLGQVKERKLPKGRRVATRHWEEPETHLVLREDGHCTEGRPLLVRSAPMGTGGYARWQSWATMRPVWGQRARGWWSLGLHILWTCGNKEPPLIYVMGFIVSPKRIVHILTPNTCECDLICWEGLCRWNRVRWGHTRVKWAFNPLDWYRELLLLSCMCFEV